eukprot:6491642-Amphidinium_carterae.1
MMSVGVHIELKSKQIYVRAVEMPLTEFLERANLTKHLGILQDLGVETSSDVLAYLKDYVSANATPAPN